MTELDRTEGRSGERQGRRRGSGRIDIKQRNKRSKKILECEANINSDRLHIESE